MGKVKGYLSGIDCVLIFLNDWRFLWYKVRALPTIVPLIDHIRSNRYDMSVCFWLGEHASVNGFSSILRLVS